MALLRSAFPERRVALGASQKRHYIGSAFLGRRIAPGASQKRHYIGSAFLGAAHHSEHSIHLSLITIHIRGASPLPEFGASHLRGPLMPGGEHFYLAFR